MDIYLKKAVLHIIDREAGDPIYSQKELDLTAEYIRDYLTKKIQKISSAQTKVGILHETSPFALAAKQAAIDFVAASEAITSQWYEQYRQSEEAPRADVFVVLYEQDTELYLALLKINYHEAYTHLIEADPEIANQLIIHRAILSNKSQKADEGLTVNLETLAYELIEKRYLFSGEKQLYFSTRVIQSKPEPSLEENVRVIKKAAEKIGEKFENAKHDVIADMKEAVYEVVEETGELNTQDIAKRVFKDNVSAQLAFQEEVEEKGYPETIPLLREAKTITEKKYGKQKLRLSNGIELIVPLEVYRNKDLIEFINNPDGTISVTIKNIEEVINRI